ncbi:MAG: tagatose 1,6-diphosphate aldolase [Acidimicrobiia bacterium]
MELKAGKLWRLRRLADPEGFMTMLAVDQRPPIEQLVARARGEATARPEDVAGVKLLLVEELADTASAVLIDPLLGYPRAADALRPDRGLLMTLEHALFEETPQGRISRPIPGWSVEAIARAGADAVKVLVWYRPDADPALSARQRRWAEAVGAECRRLDIPFVLELLLYPLGDRPVPEEPETRAAAVLDSVLAFSAPEFGVDLFKLESPVPPGALQPLDSASGRDHQSHFRALDEACGRPWVVLSAGAGQDEFTRVVQHAAVAGACGYLAGRAIWSEPLSAFPDVEACRDALALRAVPFARRLNSITRAHGRPWHAHPGYGDGGPTLAGPDFIARHGS